VLSVTACSPCVVCHGRRGRAAESLVQHRVIWTSRYATSCQRIYTPAYMQAPRAAWQRNSGRLKVCKCVVCDGVFSLRRVSRAPWKSRRKLGAASRHLDLKIRHFMSADPHTCLCASTAGDPEEKFREVEGGYKLPVTASSPCVVRHGRRGRVVFGRCRAETWLGRATPRSRG